VRGSGGGGGILTIDSRVPASCGARVLCAIIAKMGIQTQSFAPWLSRFRLLLDHCYPRETPSSCQWSVRAPHHIGAQRHALRQRVALRGHLVLRHALHPRRPPGPRAAAPTALAATGRSAVSHTRGVAGSPPPARSGRRFIANKRSHRDRSMTYLQGECSYRRAEEDEIQRLSSACVENIGLTDQPTSDRPTIRTSVPQNCDAV